MADEADYLDTSLKQFDTIISFVQEERALSLQDRRFAFIAGAQWEGDWGEQFINVPQVEINKTAAGLDKIVNDYRANRMTVDFRPADGAASEDTADMLDGLFRADAYHSKAQQALDNAFEEGAAGGYGAWRVTNEYEDDYDPDNDHQRICTYAIMDADQSVFWDPNAKLYDKSDAEYCFVITAMATEAFQREYGANRLTTWPPGIWKLHYDWFTPEVVRVAEKYEVEVKTVLRRIFSNPITGEEERHWATEMQEGQADDLIAQGWQELPSRKVKRRRIAKTVMSGAEILKPKRYIAGDCIPIIPFYGQRRFIDNMERAQGHVRKAKDPARVYNSQIAQLVETTSLTPREVPIFDPSQVAGLESHWSDMNVERHAYALARALRNEDGSVAHLGPIGTLSPPQLQPVLAALIQITAGDIRELTNADDGADQVIANTSAEAMDIAATRTDEKSAIYMDNMRQSVQRWGEVYLGMAREVYVEEGRTVETLGEDGEDGQAVLQEPYTDAMGNYSIRNDLARGRYKVISDVTEATATRRDKTVKAALNGAQIAAPFDPELASALLNMAFLNIDGEGLGDLQEWIRGRMVRQGIIKPTEEEQQQLAAEAENQQPDPQSQALIAVAEKEAALAGKAAADTKQSEAKTVLTLAQAAKTAADTGKTVEETQQIGRDAMRPETVAA